MTRQEGNPIAAASPRDGQSGVVLFNVLVIVAFMALIVMAMVSMSDIAIARSQRFSEAGQATLYIIAGEKTALSALSLDLSVSPDTDHLQEPWALIAQDRVEIEGGFFALDITDMQGLYNLTNLRPVSDLGAAPPDTRLLAGLVAGLDMPPDLTGRIRARMAEEPPVTALSDLVAAQAITAAQATALGDVVTVLPLPSPINLNTAPLAVLTALVGNAPQARVLDSIRVRKGFVTETDLAVVRMLPDARSGYASGFFRVRVTVTVGQTEQAFSSLIYRDAKAEDGMALRLVSRSRILTPRPIYPVQDETLARASP